MWKGVSHTWADPNLNETITFFAGTNGQMDRQLEKTY